MGGISNGGGTPSGGRSGSGGGGGTTLGGAGGLPASNGGSAVGQGGSTNGGGAGRGGSGANGGNGGSGGSGANAGRGGSAAGGSSGGHAGRGGSGGATGGAGTRGGSGGMGGSTAMGGSGGMGGSTAMGGSGGGTVSELAEGQPARADSEETAKGNVASKANDGNPAASSRWCPADGKTGHWWQVDLGQVRDVSSLELTWEWDQRLYGYELTVSTDGTTFSQVLDRTDNPSRARVQTESITAEGRYFRLQVTALPTGTPITWGCLSELKLFGR